MAGVVTQEWPSHQALSVAAAVKPRRVLVTGADGFIGTVLTPLLVERGYDVVGLDSGFYRAGLLYNDGKDRPVILTRDVRTVSPRDLEGYDAVVHLAEIANDPISEQDVQKTYEINHLGSVALASAAKEAGVSRFIYASSCNIYGAAVDDVLTEESKLRPQTAHAHCKMLVERDVQAMADDDFSPTFLRNATAFGASPRIRFDIVLNNLAGLAWTTGRIAMSSDGAARRPLVHVRDISSAIVATLVAPRETVAGQILNVGDNDNNYRLREIVEAVGRAFPNCRITFGDQTSEESGYRVSFDKIRKVLPGFRCSWSAERGARQMRALFEHISMDEHEFNASSYSRPRQLQKLVERRQIDSDFYWRSSDFS